MRIAVRLIFLAAVLAAAFWFWQVLFPSPEKIIRKQMTALATAATFSSSDSIIARGLKARRIGDFFTPDAQIALSGPDSGDRTVSGREDIADKTAMAFSSLQALRVEFVDVSVTVASDRQSATVTCTGQVHANDQKDLGVQELQLQFQKVDGHWLIARIESVKTLT
ncbi:MAG TPA: nuclear transport factor 2 family protein [Dongiaceae bacterium]|jgi:hypothetical protein|nr:nuclear transport factor 2 family protein [Dongiaceae bacterium]